MNCGGLLDKAKSCSSSGDNYDKLPTAIRYINHRSLSVAQCLGLQQRKRSTIDHFDAILEQLSWSIVQFVCSLLVYIGYF